MAVAVAVSDRCQVTHNMKFFSIFICLNILDLLVSVLLFAHLKRLKCLPYAEF